MGHNVPVINDHAWKFTEHPIMPFDEDIITCPTFIVTEIDGLNNCNGFFVAILGPSFMGLNAF